MRRLSPLTYSLAFVLLGYGLVLFFFGPCLTAIADTYGVPLGRLGLIFTLYSVSVIPAVFFCGHISEVIGRRAVLLASLLLMSAGCALFGAAPSFGARPHFPVALAVVLLLGAGGGGIETLTNIVIAHDNRPRPAFALNFTHAFFAIGAVLGPVAAAMVLRAELPWRATFYGGAVLFVIMFFALLPRRMPARQGAPFSPAAAVALLRSRVLWVFLGVMSLYVGAEVGLSTWVSPLMERVLGSPRSLAGLSVSTFWALMIVGRVAVSPISARLHPAPIILVLSGGSVAAGIGVAASRSPVGCLIACGAFGLCMSGIFGLVLTHAAQRFPDDLGAVFGMLLTGVGLGPLTVPAVMGWIAESAGLREAMLVPPGLMAGVAAAYLVWWARVGRSHGRCAGGEGEVGRESRGGSRD